MPTPLGPVPRDPNDPDLWDEWYDDADPDSDDLADALPHRWPTGMRIVAAVVLVAFILLYAINLR